MARKKGSLNKATIERLKAEGKWDEVNNCPLSNEGNKEVEIEKAKVEEFKTEVTEEPEIEEPEIEEPEINPTQETSIQEDSLSNPNDLIPTNEATKALESILNDSKGKSKASSKNPRELTCERCGAIIDGSPYRIDTNAITARPDYHRETPRYVSLCSKCSRELSEIVDKWLLAGECGDELRKFPL